MGEQKQERVIMDVGQTETPPRSQHSKEGKHRFKKKKKTHMHTHSQTQNKNSSRIKRTFKWAQVASRKVN